LVSQLIRDLKERNRRKINTNRFFFVIFSVVNLKSLHIFFDWKARVDRNISSPDCSERLLLPFKDVGVWLQLPAPTYYTHPSTPPLSSPDCWRKCCHEACSHRDVFISGSPLMTDAFPLAWGETGEDFKSPLLACMALT